jgi:hypothetical protein
MLTRARRNDRIVRGDARLIEKIIHAVSAVF